MNQAILSSRKAKGKALLRWILVALAVLIGSLLAYDGCVIFYSANFRTIVSGEAYRSGQMNAAQLSRVIREYGIKSIINLRGTDASALYQGEMETAKRLGVQHYDFSLSAINEITLAQMDDVIRTLRGAPKPVLIHCQAGSDRTGLVSALYCLAIKGETPAQADRELSVWYGHVSLSKTIAMDHSFWHYVSSYLARAEPNLRAETRDADASPVAVPEPGPKAVSFYHSTMLLIAVIILWSLLIPLVFLFAGFSSKLRSWAERLGRNWYVSYAIYWTAFSLICFLLFLPLAFYGGFIHLHHYDLSNQSFARWLCCSVKGAAIVLAGGLAVGWIPFFIIKKSPRRWWLYLGLLAPLYLCFSLWIQPVLIAPLFHKFTPLQDQELEAKIFAEATRAGIQGGRIYQVNASVDSKVENAYVTGLMGTERIVFYDTLLQNMKEDELLFVMGHEMGHYVLWHRAKRIAFKSILILVSLYVAYRLAGPVIGRFKAIWGFAAPSDFAAMPLGVLAFCLFCFAAQPINMVFSRHLEHEADRFGLELTHANRAAATVFVKLIQVGLGVPRHGAFFTIWFDSHPCIADRIEFCNTYRPWETGQSSKYLKYFRPAEGIAGPPLSSAQNNEH